MTLERYEGAPAAARPDHPPVVPITHRPGRQSTPHQRRVLMVGSAAAVAVLLFSTVRACDHDAAPERPIPHPVVTVTATPESAPTRATASPATTPGDALAKRVGRGVRHLWDGVRSAGHDFLTGFERP